VFGAIVLSGGADVVRDSSGQAPATNAAALAFSRVFLAATISLMVAFVGLLLMAEKPLQTNRPQHSP
jgi:hypothetical protein